MLDHQPIDVGNVKRAVGPCFEHRRAEPVIAGSEEFAVLFVRRASAGEGDAVGF